MKSSAPFRTFPHFSALTPHPLIRPRIRTAAPPPIGVRGAAAEGETCGGDVPEIRTASALGEFA